MLGDGRRYPLAERSQQLRLGLEAVLVEVPARAPARAEDEVAFEQRVLAEQAAELRVVPLGYSVTNFTADKAAVIRVCVGSATVAGLTTVGIILPLIQSQNVNPELMVLAIGSGSLMLSHINDAGFWLFKEYFNLSINDTLRTWTVMESLVSVIGLLGVLALNLVV